MKLLTKVAVGVLLGFGLPLTLLATIAIFHPKSTSEDRDNLIAVIFFALPPTALGSYLLWSGYQQNQQRERDRLRSTFFQLLQEGQGHINALQFAMRTGLEGQVAKLYLDDRAKEFSANFNISEEGNLSYFFDLGGANLTGASSGNLLGITPGRETYDVILEYVPSQSRRDVVRVIHDMVGLSWSEAKTLVNQQTNPLILKQGVDKATAIKFKKHLEAAGAEIMIVLR
jgi:ribosomal protein L7/L12